MKKIFVKENVPNILTVIRALLVPVFMVLLIFVGRKYDIAMRITCAALFGLISLTDMLDGKIARKYNYISDFGKFLDPLADKILIFGAIISLIVFMGREAGVGYIYAVCSAFALFILFVREIAVTSLRMLFKTQGGHALAANYAGKIKTVTQMIFVLASLLEPALVGLFTDKPIWVLTFLSMFVMTLMTVISGCIYFKEYVPLIKGQKQDA